MTRPLALVLLLTGVLASGAVAEPNRGGKVLYRRSGMIERPMLPVTQETFLAHNQCRSTKLNGTETNELSAAVLDVAAYKGQQLSVSYTEEIGLGGFFNVAFYTRDCQQTDVTDDSWTTKRLQRPAVGRIPQRASWLMLSHAQGFTKINWSVEIRALPPVVAAPPAEALCRQVTDPAGDDADPQLDLLSADVAVDSTAVTVGLRLAKLDHAPGPTVPRRAYVVEFTVPDGRVFYLGMVQDYPGLHLAGHTLRAVAGTKDASGYHPASYPTRRWYDTATGEIRVSAPLAKPKQGESIGTAAKFDRGKRLTAITARSIDGSLADAPPLRADRDVATAKSAYVIGTPTCLQRVVD